MGRGLGGTSALGLAREPQGSHLAASVPRPRSPPALTHAAAPRGIQHEAGLAGAQVAAPGVHALGVPAQAQGQALVDICRVGGDDHGPAP